MMSMHRVAFFSVVLLGCGASPRRAPPPEAEVGPSEGADPPPIAPLPESAICSEEDDDCRLDRLGPVRLDWLVEGLPIAQVIEKLGPPATREPPVEEGATGEWVSVAAWPDQGITVLLTAGAATEDGTVRGIWVRPPSTLQTDRGIGLGASAGQVHTAYGNTLDPRGRADQLVAGSIYGGVTFTLASGRVVEIFVGPGAE